MHHSYSSCIEVRNTRKGKGLFVSETISEGTVLVNIWGKILSFEQTLALKNNESYCLQTGIDKYIALHFPVFLSNHSCNPNCGINNQMEFLALRKILKGEELTWDYSTSMLERHWTLHCKCGEKNCRKKIEDFDCLPADVQKKYLQMGIVLPFIIAELKLDNYHHALAENISTHS